VAYDGSGAVVLRESGLVVRLNGGNLLVLAGIGWSGDGVGVAGVAIGDYAGEPVGLGRLPEGVLAERCSWSERHLVCPDRSGAEIWQFAGG
jgi:hypothetical protein